MTETKHSDENFNLTHAFANEKDSYSPLLRWPTEPPKEAGAAASQGQQSKQR